MRDHLLWLLVDEEVIPGERGGGELAPGVILPALDAGAIDEGILLPSDRQDRQR
jgi:hypothetical protein